MYHFANGDSIHKAAKKLKLSPEVANHWYDKCQVIAQAHLRVCTPKDVGKRRAKFDDPQEEYDAAHYVDHKYQVLKIVESMFHLDEVKDKYRLRIMPCSRSTWI